MTIVVEVGPNLRWVLLVVGLAGLGAFTLKTWWMTLAILRTGRG